MASLRQRLFAWTLKSGDRFNHALYGSYKKQLFAQLQGTVIEVGPGSGVNFPYYPKGTNWIGIEPNEAFHDGLLRQARVQGISARLVTGNASAIPLADNVADAVVCTLVLCSVPDPEKALAEMKRVLKVCGKLYFIEHVAAPAHSTLRRWQNILNPLNRAIADHCNCNRETWITLEKAGFSKVDLSHQRIESAMKLHSPHIIGYAIK